MNRVKSHALSLTPGPRLIKSSCGDAVSKYKVVNIQIWLLAAVLVLLQRTGVMDK